MNCSEFDRQLKELVETRGESPSESLLAHATACELCNQQWRDHLLLEAALRSWRPVPSPSLANGVLSIVFEDRERRQMVIGNLDSRRRWLVVAVAAACLMIALSVGITRRYESGARSLALKETGHSGQPSRPDSGSVDEPPVGVASSVAAVFEDLRSEYSELAAETRATAREFVIAIPSPGIPPWSDQAPTDGPNSVDPDGQAIGSVIDNAPVGAVSVIGRSIGTQIGAAMDFLWVAVPDGVPRG